MGEFTGFTFGDITSADLGITRVSGGDRYDEELHPEIKDRTAEVPGVNGEYYFGSDYGTKTFDIEIAFDHLTEIQFRKLRKVFGTKEIKQLIFDECPYKYYMAKLESPVELSYVCFDELKRRPGDTIIHGGVRYTEENGELVKEDITPWVYEFDNNGNPIKECIYKGEGKITFVCYFPFAKSTFKVLPEQGEAYYEGSEKWAISSGILSRADYALYDTYIINTSTINVYNAGDIPTGFRLYIPFVETETQITLTYQAKEDLTDYDILQFTLPARVNGRKYDENNKDIGVLIDTNNQLIIGVQSDSNNIVTASGNLYNDCIDAGYFFKLQPNILSDNATIEITNGNEGIRIFYDYLYF